VKLSEEEAKSLEHLDIVKGTHQAREESMRLLNDQGLTALSIAISNFIADIAEHPEKVVKEFVGEGLR
jgi:uncharacterized protein (UPF0212 family)